MDIKPPTSFVVHQQKLLIRIHTHICAYVNIAPCKWRFVGQGVLRCIPSTRLARGVGQGDVAKVPGDLQASHWMLGAKETGVARFPRKDPTLVSIFFGGRGREKIPGCPFSASFSFFFSFFRGKGVCGSMLRISCFRLT